MFCCADAKLQDNFKDDKKFSGEQGIVGMDGF